MSGRTTLCSDGCRHPECAALRRQTMPEATTHHLHRNDRQARTLAWVTATFGSNPAALAPQERALRLLEEVLELVHVEHVTPLQIGQLVAHVYGKPIGDRAQELGGVGVTLLAYAATVGLSTDDEEARELARVLALPPEHFRKRQNAKADAGVAARVAEGDAEQRRCNARAEESYTTTPAPPTPWPESAPNKKTDQPWRPPPDLPLLGLKPDTRSQCWKDAEARCTATEATEAPADALAIVAEEQAAWDAAHPKPPTVARLQRRIAFLERVLSISRPHSHRCNAHDPTVCKLAPDGQVCCNPACRGEWGTGCWCCHYGAYAIGVTDEEIEAALAAMKVVPR